MNNYFKQILYDLRHQRVVTITSMLGTAFAIFLVMAVFTIGSIDSVPVSPETNRPHILMGKHLHIKGDNSDSSGHLSYGTASELYNNLDGISKISFVSDEQAMDASVDDGEIVSVKAISADENFWDIFDFKFLTGKPFDKATVESQLKEVILQRGTALRLFGTDDIVGREVQLNHVPYRVRGVVDNTSPLLRSTYANAYLPYAPEKPEQLWNEYCGQTATYLLTDGSVSVEDIREQVKSRYATFTARISKQGLEALYHQSPYTIDIAHNTWSNCDPDTTTARNTRYIIYCILLVLPAINISSMTRSRLRLRVSEIGVRRAYGATKWSILGRFLTENLVLTLAGGIIGLVLCVIFVTLFSNMFISYGGIFADADMVNARPTIQMLLNFNTFAIALVFCLILNILSTGMPAWRASRVNPAEAISGKK